MASEVEGVPLSAADRPRPDGTARAARDRAKPARRHAAPDQGAHLHRRSTRTSPNIGTVIGITPAWQGRGYGAALLRAMLERCDTDRVAAYLEASSARSRAL